MLSAEGMELGKSLVPRRKSTKVLQLREKGEEIQALLFGVIEGARENGKSSIQRCGKGGEGL